MLYVFFSFHGDALFELIKGLTVTFFCLPLPIELIVVYPNFFNDWVT